MRVSYRTVKKGRSITHIVFRLNEWTDKDFFEFEQKWRAEVEAKLARGQKL